jgi:AcrR family transcriptional regulator
MPRLSDEVREKRRRHVLESAWKCFSRQGFHATSMDQIIAESGMSSAAVYRYFRSKDDLIAATADEALINFRAALAGAEESASPPTPAELLGLLSDALTRQMRAPDYDMTKITVATWAESLRQPELNDRAHHFYDEVLARLTRLAEAWREHGVVRADADPVAVAKLFMTLMPGMIVIRHLGDPASAADLAAAIDAVGGRPDS